MPKESIKNKLIQIPVLGRTLITIKHIALSPKRYQEQLKTNNELLSLLTSLNSDQKNTESQLAELSDKMKSTQQSQDSISQQFALLSKGQPKTKSKKSKNADDDQLFADDHLLDAFYTAFEDKFRGDEQTIKERLQEHLPLFKESDVKFSKYPVLDIGSGRGEFLQLLKDNSISAEGLDINIDMVERSKQKGLKAVQGDALNFLLSKSPQTYGAITGFHIAEHIPFNILYRIFQACHAALTDNGFVLFETPNPENIIVGSCAFYMDPSHLHPLPPDLLAFALEQCGFRKVEIRRIHPVEGHEEEKAPEEFKNRFYGPRDYAVIGYK